MVDLFTYWPIVPNGTMSHRHCQWHSHVHGSKKGIFPEFSSFAKGTRKEKTKSRVEPNLFSEQNPCRPWQLSWYSWLWLLCLAHNPSPWSFGTQFNSTIKEAFPYHAASNFWNKIVDELKEYRRWWALVGNHFGKDGAILSYICGT